MSPKKSVSINLRMKPGTKVLEVQLFWGLFTIHFLKGGSSGLTLTRMTRSTRTSSGCFEFAT